MNTQNIYLEFDQQLSRLNKEKLLKQKGIVLWLYGLSGSGKSTIANAAEKVLHNQGKITTILDEDNLRNGINQNLSFSDEDRRENIRRIAHIAKLFANQGIITFVPVITPHQELRDMVRDIVGDDYFSIYVKADYSLCKKRDVKGLYAKAAREELPHFTKKNNPFEEPISPDLILETNKQSVEDCVFLLLESFYSKTSS